METQEYNGWTNRETWATMLYIDNDQGLYETAKDYAVTALEEHSGEESEARYCLAETLENWFDTLAGDFTELSFEVYSMLRDIGSLYRVNWREIADSLISNVKEEVTA